MSQIFRNEWNLLCLAAIIAGISFLIAKHQDFLTRKFIHNSQWLFWQLCRAHRLDLGSRLFLWNLAKAAKLKNPAQIFLNPERFSAAGLGRVWATETERLEKLRHKLFDR